MIRPRSELEERILGALFEDLVRTGAPNALVGYSAQGYPIRVPAEPEDRPNPAAWYRWNEPKDPSRAR